MLSTFADFQALIRDVVFSNAPAEMRFCFGLVNTEDASQNQAGDLFTQNGEFFIFEAETDRVGRAGPGHLSPRRVWATLSVTLASKETHDELELLRRLERVAGWFGDGTIGGVRFRQFVPLGSSSLMGFLAHDGVIGCDFEMTPMTR